MSGAKQRDLLEAEQFPAFSPDYLTEGSVLAIDDDAHILALMKDLLELSGLNVITAHGGSEGIELFRIKRPDLVITDIRMPHMDGLEVLRSVGEIDNAVPVILVTGYGDLENAVRALRRGAYDFLLKPINPEILMNAVRKGLEHCWLKRFEKNSRIVLERRVEERTRELAKANDELEKTNEFLQGILNSSTKVSIVLTDFDRTVLFWNKGAENIFGYTEDEMIGSAITKLYAPESEHSNGLDQLRQVMERKWETAQANVEQVSKDGRRLTISLTVSSMRDSNNNVKGVLGVGQDVTEQVHLHQELLRSYQRIKNIQGASVFALARLAESRDGETGFHLKRIQAYCRVLCKRLAEHEDRKAVMTAEFVENLVQCSVLHDIGKVAIPDTILFNPRKFGVDEYEIMKQHSIHGGKALMDAAKDAGDESYLALASDIAKHHHEKWDGSGYPDGLKGEEIPLAARIVAVADVYDALITERRYKRSYSHEEAKAIILENRGKHFDPELVDVFLEVEDEFKKIFSHTAMRKSAS